MDELSVLNNFNFQKQLVLNLSGIFCAVVGVLLNLTQLYLMAAILLLIPIVSNWIGRILMRGLKCDRNLPASCSESEEIAIDLTITNTGWLPKFYIRAEDRLPIWLRKNAYLSPVILLLMPGKGRQISYTLEPLKRGVHVINAVRVTSTDPLGFANYRFDVPEKSTLLVYPTVLPLRRPFLEDSSAMGWRGYEYGSVRGSGHEFYGIRGYQVGDEVRRVHWPTTARTGKLTVVESAFGSSLDAILIIDLFAESYRGLDEGIGGALEVAVQIAATLCNDLLRRSQRVRLIGSYAQLSLDIFADNARAMPNILEELAKVTADGTKSLGAVMGDRIDSLPVGATVIYITPDSGSEMLFSSARDLEVRNIRICGFGLVATSYKRAKGKVSRLALSSTVASEESDEQAFVGPGAVQQIRRGDNLATQIERFVSVRK